MNTDMIQPHQIVTGMLVLAVALGIAVVNPSYTFAAVGGSFVFFVMLVSTQAGLYLLIVAMMFSPEIAVGGPVGKGIGGRSVTLRLEDLLVIGLGFIWLVKTAVHKELPLLKWTPVNSSLFIYILVCVVATIVATLTGDIQSQAAAFYILKYFEYFFIFFLTINHISTRAQANQCLMVLLLTCFGATLFAMSFIPSGERATAPFEGEIGEPNTLGGYLVLMSAVIIGLLLHLPATPLRYILFALLGCSSLALLGTLSRSSYLAAMVLVISVVFSQRFNPMVIGAMVIGAGLLLVVMPEGVQERVLFTFEQPREAGQIHVGEIHIDTSTSERLRAWKQGLTHWIDRPFLGKGVASVWWADAQYIKVLAETGLVGLIAFFFIFVRLWQGTREAYATVRDPLGKGLAFGFLLAIIPLLVHAIGTNTFIIVRIMEPFWFLAGLVMLLPTFQRQADEQEDRTASRLVLG